MHLTYLWQDRKIRVSLKVAVAGALLALLFAPSVSAGWESILLIGLSAVGGFFLGGALRQDIGLSGWMGYLRSFWAGLRIALATAAVVGLVLVPPFGVFGGPLVFIGALVNPLVLLVLLSSGSMIHFSERRRVAIHDTVNATD